MSATEDDQFDTEEVQEQYSDKISSIREENGFTGGSLICKYITTSDGGKYGQYAYLVSPPSEGREWHYVGKCGEVDTKPADTGSDDEEQMSEVEFEEININDAPFEKPSEKLEYTYDSPKGEVDITIELEDGAKTVKVSGPVEGESTVTEPHLPVETRRGPPRFQCMTIQYYIQTLQSASAHARLDYGPRPQNHTPLFLLQTFDTHRGFARFRLVWRFPYYIY